MTETTTHIPLQFYIDTIRQYIYQRKGVVVNIVIDTNNEAHLALLFKAYDMASGNG